MLGLMLLLPINSVVTVDVSIGARIAHTHAGICFCKRRNSKHGDGDGEEHKHAKRTPKDKLLFPI